MEGWGVAVSHAMDVKLDPFCSDRPYGLDHDAAEDLMAGSSHASTGFEDSLFHDHTGVLMSEMLMEEPFGTNGSTDQFDTSLDPLSICHPTQVQPPTPRSTGEKPQACMDQKWLLGQGEPLLGVAGVLEDEEPQACGWPAASHGSNEVTSNTASGLEPTPTGACGTSSAAEEGDSHTAVTNLMDDGLMAAVQDIDPKCDDFCLDFDLGPDFGLLGMEDDDFCMGPISAEPWVLTACTSSHPLSHHCPGATNIELLEDPDELGTSNCHEAPMSAPAAVRPIGSHQLSAPSSPGTARSMPHQQHVPYSTAARRSSGSNHQQRPRAPPLLAPQPPRTSMHTPFISVGAGGRNEPVASAVVGHPSAWAGGNATSPSADISDSAELSHADMPNSPSWGNPAGNHRKNPTAARLAMRPARSMPSFASLSGPAPTTGSPRAASMVPDLLAPAPKRQAPLRRSPSEGYELPRARPNGVHSVPPVMAPALRSHASNSGLNMVAPVDVGYGVDIIDIAPGDDELGGLGELESAWNEFSAPEPPPPSPPPPPVHPPLPHFPNGPVIPPEAQPALAALAAMLPPRNNRKRANGGHGSTCARPAPHPHGHGCTACGTQTTPVWRAGPAGPKTLCNACGVRYMKVARGGGLPPPKKS